MARGAGQALRGHGEKHPMATERKLRVSGTRRLLWWRDHVLTRNLLSGTAFAFLLFWVLWDSSCLQGVQGVADRHLFILILISNSGCPGHRCLGLAAAVRISNSSTAVPLLWHVLSWGLGGS